MAQRVDEWMPLYVSKYLADTMHLTTEQHGAYFLMLMSCWTSDGRLPADDDSLMSVTKLPNPKWRQHKAKLLKYFVADGDFIVHEKVVSERRKAREVSEKKVKSGEKGAANRWQTDSKTIANAINLPLQNDGKPNSKTIDLNNIQNTTVPIGTGAVAPRDPVKSELWGLGKQLLVEKSGMTEQKAGEILGKLVKDNTAPRVLDAVRHCIRESIADPKTYLLAMKREDGKIAALERNNDDAVAEFLKKSAHARSR